MGDVLSQNEIDNLLAALSTGELDVDEIKDNNEKGKRVRFCLSFQIFQGTSAYHGNDI